MTNKATGKSKEKIYRDKIKKNIKNVLENGYIPELGYYKKGKVRDVHFSDNKIGSPIVMIASDRVSAFDHILNESIPYKGKVLNLFTEWAFANTKDIIPNALIDLPSENVVVQKKLKNVGFEFIVRGFVWGSMAHGYENGDRGICGIKLPDGLIRYEKLTEPLFTPTTKYDEHDENISYSVLEKNIGNKMAAKIKLISMKLFNRASELADSNGFVFIDTKYEFGLDENDDLYLIDEANTPDSSRYCTKKEYEKFEKIKNEIKSGKFTDVTELLGQKPELKIEELSKQFVRDVLTESGFSYGASGDNIPSLTEDQVVETSYRYISLYEKVTGEKFDFGNNSDVRQVMVSSLVNSNYIKGGLAVIMAGSDSDSEHVEAIGKELEKYNIPSVVRICSAHKQGGMCTDVVEQYNKSVEPILIVAVAGGTDALSGLASFHSVWPVISCPPKKEEFESCIANPPGSSNALILRPGNVAKFTAQYFGYSSRALQNIIVSNNKKKIASLVEADINMSSK